MVDPVALTQRLIRCPSIAPVDAGALDIVQRELETLGFTCHRMIFEEEGTEPIDNLYARLGSKAPNICFAGHTDVVPAGDEATWKHPPFAGTIEDGILYGRGAVDMKTAIACFIRGVEQFLHDKDASKLEGSISFLITGDEEACSINGTRKVLQWMQEQGEILDAAIVGEPTNPEQLGEMIKIGRRGSIGFDFIVKGTQGHVAYPHNADNPIPRMAALVDRMVKHVFDEGTEHFDPTHLEVTTIDVGNGATNVIPAQAKAYANIRFNPFHSGESLIKWANTLCQEIGGEIDCIPRISGEAFLTQPGPLSEIVVAATESVLGKTPVLSTTGGTSDARFIKDYCPVVECGLINKTAHKLDECVALDDIHMLSEIYTEILERYFKAV